MYNDFGLRYFNHAGPGLNPTPSLMKEVPDMVQAATTITVVEMGFTRATKNKVRIDREDKVSPIEDVYLLKEAFGDDPPKEGDRFRVTVEKLDD